MKLEVISQIPWVELEEKIRRVPLKKVAADGTQIFVYSTAKIEPREFLSDEVNPTSFYALNKNLQTQRDLRAELLKKYNIDTLKLENGVVILNHDTQQEWTLIPPIIELTPRTIKYVAQHEELSYDESVRVQIPIVNDGLHRVMLAKELQLPFKGVYISGANAAFPFYAHPNSWEMVKFFDDIPKTTREKKLYSRADCYGLYRDFGVLGCGAPRNLGK